MSDLPGEGAANELFEEALACFEDDRPREAEGLLTRYIAQYPDAPDAFGSRGLVRMQLGEEDAAVEDFRQVLRLDPADARAHSALADAYRFADAPQALEHIAAALELDPDEAQALWVRGWLFADAGQYAAAFADLERHLDLVRAAERAEEKACDDPDCPDCHPAGDKEAPPDDGDDDGLDAEERETVERLHRHGTLMAFKALCRILAFLEARQDEAQQEEFAATRERHLSRHGWSFDYAPRPLWGETAMPACRWGHCVWNLRECSKTVPVGCVWLSRRCPGGPEQVRECAERFNEEDFQGQEAELPE